MNSMFHNAAHFSQAIGSWDVAAVRDMNYMFYGAKSFNRPIESWNVSSVANMKAMFYKAAHFNQAIGSWDVAAVRDMSFMFYGAKSFNRPIGLWNISSVETMPGMFSGATSFDQDLGLWDTSAVSDISAVFSGAKSFNKPLSTWNFSAVQDSTSPFDGSGVTRCVESRAFQALGWPLLNFQAFGFSFEPCPFCPCRDPSLACVDGRCSPLNSGFIDLGRGNKERQVVSSAFDRSGAAGPWPFPVLGASPSEETPAPREPVALGSGGDAAARDGRSTLE